jgi:hypothetical protein
MEFMPFFVAGVQKAGETISKRRHKKDRLDDQSQAPPPYEDDGQAEAPPPEYLEACEQPPTEPGQNTQQDNHQQDTRYDKEGQ